MGGTHARADPQVVHCDSEQNPVEGRPAAHGSIGAGNVTHQAPNGKNFTVRVSRPGLLKRTSRSGPTESLNFYLTVDGTRQKLYADERQALAEAHKMMSDFLAWFFGDHIYALPAWLPESYTKWTAMKLARRAKEPAPRTKYAARSHALALVRVPGRAPPRSGSGCAKESASAPACGAGTDCGEFGRPIAARAHGTVRAERAVPVRELGRPQDPPHAIAVEALRRRTPRGTPTPFARSGTLDRALRASRSEGRRGVPWCASAPPCQGPVGDRYLGRARGAASRASSRSRRCVPGGESSGGRLVRGSRAH